MSSRQSSYEMHERYVLANKGGEIMINELKDFNADEEIYFIIDYVVENTDNIKINEFLFEYGYTYYGWLHELDKEFIYTNWFELREFLYDMIIYDYESNNLIYPNYKH